MSRLQLAHGKVLLLGMGLHTASPYSNRLNFRPLGRQMNTQARHRAPCTSFVHMQHGLLAWLQQPAYSTEGCNYCQDCMLRFILDCMSICGIAEVQSNIYGEELILGVW